MSGAGDTDGKTDTHAAQAPGLQRSIDWKGAFWIASGVPALVLISIGGMGAAVGKLAFVVWSISVVIGLLQAYSYAEIAGLFANKSGGAAVYGAAAWLRYAKVAAPLSVWCNWYAWSPVLALGCVIAASYILNAIAPVPIFTAESPEVIAWLRNSANASAIDSRSALEATKIAVTALTDSAAPTLRTFKLADFSFLGIAKIELGATFFIAALLMLIAFAIQHRGILGTAKIQKWIGMFVVVPMLIVGIVPFLNGSVHVANYMPLLPPTGAWNNAGWTQFFGALFIAGWSTYAFETAVCYTSEFKNPGADTKKAIISAGLLCVLVYTLVAATFQGYLGVEGMTQPGIVDGTGVASAMGQMVGGGSKLVTHLMEMLMVLALLLAIMMAMAGSSRTLYQGGIDGWLPRYLGQTNEHGAPTNAMWTDLVFNLGLLTFAASDTTAFFLILSMSNVGYMVFVFLNLQSTWIHRIDSPDVPRPYRAPNILVAVAAGLGFFNIFLMGAGAKLWGNPNALWYGLLFGVLIVPVFYYRHYVQDKGRFPDHMLVDLNLKGQDLGARQAGVLPYLTLAAGAIIALFGHFAFQLPPT